MAIDPIYEVYAIRFATNPARLRGQNFIGDANPTQQQTMDFFCWLIVGQDTSIVVDTGTHRSSVESHGLQFIQCPAETMAALGCDPGRVRTVILTHLHFDHIGNVDKFPSAHFYLPRVEMAYATGPSMKHGFLRRAYGTKELSTVLEYLYQDRVTLHEQPFEVAPGVAVHHVGGHTAGQEVVRVHTARGWIVLASDALHYYEELERGQPFAVAYHIGDMLAAHPTMRRMVTSDDHIIPAHDPRVMELYPAARPELAGMAARVDLAPRVTGASLR